MTERRLENSWRHSDPTDGHSWTAFMRANSAVLFQTSLLLAADCEVAECGILAALASVDLSRPPAPDDLFVLQRAVATQTLKLVISKPEKAKEDASSWIQVGLRPVVQLGQMPRICFVLCLLLRFPFSACAQILALQEETVQHLLLIAARELSVCDLDL